MTTDTLISTHQLVKRYPTGKTSFTALKDISITVKQGEFSGIIGPSGSGKTTLLNIIGSLDTPSEGSCEVLGNKIESLRAKQAALLRSQHIGFIFQTYNLLPVYTVYENIEFPLLLLNHTPAERSAMVMQAIEWVGLTDKVHSKPPSLSGGQAQRVSIARAIVKQPKIVLADEPTANLDADNSHHILKVMKTLNEELKTTFLFSTHDDKVKQYLERKIHLLDGKIDRDEWTHGRYR